MIKTINKLISHIVHLSRPEKIVLFGSAAIGNQNTFSDIDLLIIAELAGRKNDLKREIMCFAQEFSLKVDVFIHTGREIEKATHNLDPFLSSIMKYGMIVYDKSARMA